jgi:hypothetical protein
MLPLPHHLNTALLLGNKRSVPQYPSSLFAVATSANIALASPPSWGSCQTDEAEFEMLDNKV